MLPVKLHRQLARKHVEELPRPQMKMPLLLCARRHALFDHASECRIAQHILASRPRCSGSSPPPVSARSSSLSLMTVVWR